MIRFFPLAAFALAISCQLVRYVLGYWLGYKEQSDLLMYLLPLWILSQCFLAYAILACALILFSKARSWPFFSLLAAIVVWIGILFILPDPIYMAAYGLRDRLLQQKNLADFRSFAREIRQISGTADFGGNGRTFMREDIAKLGWKYPFIIWVRGDKFQGPTYVYVDNDIVEIRWGSSLAGLWGLDVGVNGKKIELPSDPDTKGLRLSTDIVAIAEAD